MHPISKILLPSLAAALTLSTATSAQDSGYFAIQPEGSTYSVSVNGICGRSATVGGLTSGNPDQPACGATLNAIFDDTLTDIPITYYSGDGSCDVGCSFATINPSGQRNPFAI